MTVIGAVSPPGGDLTEPVTTAHPALRPLLVDPRPRPRLRPALPGGVLDRVVLPRRRAIGAWHVRNGDPAGRTRRARIGGLLAEADRLGALAELVGAGALPGRERVVLLAGRLLREAVLQQSALSPHRRVLLAGADGRARRRGPATSSTAAPGVADRGVPAAPSRSSTSRRCCGPARRPAPATPWPRSPPPRHHAGRWRCCDGRRAGGRPLPGAGRLGRVEHTDVAELRGPLAVVRGVPGVGWDEFAQHPPRRRGAAPRPGARGRPRPGVVQVLEGTEGMDAKGTRVSRSPAPRCASRSAPAGWAGSATAAASRSTAARRCSARRRRRSRRAAQPDPARAAGRAGAHRGLGHRRADHPGARPEAAGLLGGRPAAPRARRPRSPRRPSAGGEPFSVVFAAMGLTHADAAVVRDALEERSAAGELVLLLNTADDPVIERILTPRIALTVAEHLAFALGPPRAGGHGRHDQLLRGAARGLGRPRRDPGAARLPRLPLQRPGLAVRALRADPRAAARLGHGAAGADHARPATSPTRCPTSPATSPRARWCCPPRRTPAASTRRWTRCRRCTGASSPCLPAAALDAHYRPRDDGGEQEDRR